MNLQHTYKTVFLRNSKNVECHSLGWIKITGISSCMDQAKTKSVK